MCVQVCPTGIDIRKGLQYECIACAACIDACDEVMDKVGYPRGLIRYDTQHGLEGKAEARAAPAHDRLRSLIAVLIAGFAYTISNRNVVAVDVLRDRNALFRELPGGLIENVYNVKIMNKDAAEHEFTISATGLPGLQVDYGDDRSRGRPGRCAERRGTPARAARRIAGRRGHRLHDPPTEDEHPLRGLRQGPLPRPHELIGFPHDQPDRAAPGTASCYPWLLIVPPAAAVIAGFITLYLAIANPDTLVPQGLRA